MAIDRSNTTVLYSVCTSSTRPTGPTQGMLIFETDTNDIVSYNGSVWVVISSVGGTGIGAAGYAPTGSLLTFAAAAAPTGWLICDGTSYLRATYQALFDVIGTSYGSVDGTHFNVPDLRGRTAVGAGTGTASGSTAWSLGSTPTSGAGGEQTHTLTTGEMPSHTHTQDAHTHTQNAHTHTYNTSTGVAGGGWIQGQYYNGTINQSIGTMSSTTATNQNTTATNQNTGGGSAHNIMAPLTVVNYIIKT